MTNTNETSLNQFFLQDSRGNVGDNLMFWAKKGGYTSALEKAEIFTQKDALAQNDSRFSDVPWPISYVNERGRSVVDMQCVSKAEEQASGADDSQGFYLQDPNKRYVGNDILFVSQTKKELTTNLAKALVLHLPTSFLDEGTYWAKAYIDSKSRMAFDCNDADLKAALKDSPDFFLYFKRLQEQNKKQKRERYRCCGCGVFMSESSYYVSPCKRCDADNRP